MPEKLDVTTRRKFRFTLGVGRKAYNTRNIVAPTASKPSAQYSFAAPQDGEERLEQSGPIPAPLTSRQRQASKLRESQWVSGPELARYLGVGKKKFTELFKAGLLPHRSYPPRDTLRFNIKRVEKALAKFDVKARA